MTLPLEDVEWIREPLLQGLHGSAGPGASFDDDTFVLRVSKCFSFEGSFIYLLFGDSGAVMFDTGRWSSPDNPFNHAKEASSSDDG